VSNAGIIALSKIQNKMAEQTMTRNLEFRNFAAQIQKFEQIPEITMQKKTYSMTETPTPVSTHTSIHPHLYHPTD
jgi:hypothetical protein